ncbi:hypothetical protein CHELA1G11_11267 [Hyphomicrobiales bacterium]|nr:hypothetical protein CHELA1G11_11267 [Hyphomicrobiales bacterium]CAH1668964.1 hypothetical protein CHELA1G2_13042 [Hyphomicrobiales bacterium]
MADAAQTNDCAQILADLCEAMLIIGHDGEYVHAEVAMSFELHERLSAWWQEECAW